MVKISRESVLSFVGSLNDVINSNEGDDYIDQFYDNLLIENPHLLDLVSAETQAILDSGDDEDIAAGYANHFLKGFMMCYAAISRSMQEDDL